MGNKWTTSMIVALVVLLVVLAALRLLFWRELMALFSQWFG